MDFFETQNDSRRHSTLLLAAFAVVLIVCFLVIYWYASTAAGILQKINPDLNLTLTKLVLISPMALVIISGCYKRWQDVSNGGHQLATRLGAILIERNGKQRKHTQLLNVVEEMSVAAGISPPDSYVLNNESSINAFVAGNSDHTVLVVTLGAMEKLNELELRAVVAHEIAHIESGDLDLSMKLLIALGGLNAISEAGYACFRKTQFKINDNPYTRSSGKHNFAFAYVALVIVGLLLCVLGGVFSFMGNVLKAAFTRKRELLADAKAVQYTRNTWGMASALNKIAQNKTAHGLYSKYAAQIAHMCIDAPSLHFLFPQSLATHPTLASRISAIEPHFDVKSRKKESKTDRKSKSPATGVTRTVVTPESVTEVGVRAMNDCLPELAILISTIVQASGNNEENNERKYQSTLKCYTSQSIPMHRVDKSTITVDLEHALDCLFQLPVNQKQNLLDHLAELVEHDGIHMEAETRLLDHVYRRLNPIDKAA